MADLFHTDTESNLIEIPDAEIYYLPVLKLQRDEKALLQTLIDNTPWRAEQITVWGKRYPQPRLIAWYGDDGQSYKYSGIQLSPLPWTETLLEIRQKIESATGAKFNSVLLNYYRDNRDSMGFHSDDEPELGPKPIIASLSLGERRTFILKHKTRKNVNPVRINLESGSLLLMKGETQKNWKHGIEKESRLCGARVNLTFRRILV